MIKIDIQYRLAFLALLMIACASMLFAMPAAAQSQESAIVGTTIERLETRIRETEAAADLDETSRNSLLEH